MELKHTLSNIFSWRTPARIVAVAGTATVSLATAKLTSEAAISFLEFINAVTPAIVDSPVGNIIQHAVLWPTAVFVAAQTFSPIWNELSYYGQVLDNACSRVVLKKLYFLDVVEDKIKVLQKLINEINAAIQEYYIQTPANQLMTIQNMDDNLQIIRTQQYDLRTLLNSDDVYGEHNQKRQNEAEDKLNQILEQITKLSKRINTLKSRDAEQLGHKAKVKVRQTVKPQERNKVVGKLLSKLGFTSASHRKKYDAKSPLLEESEAETSTYSDPNIKMYDPLEAPSRCNIM